MSEEQKQQEQTEQTKKGSGVKPFVLGLLLGFIGCSILVYQVMPSMMIVTHECSQGVDQTVAALEASIAENGWVVSGVQDMNKSLAKHGTAFEPSVKLVKLCKPEYAESVLTTDRFVSCLMPCSMAVWEGDDGKTYLSKMNVGLMGQMFGGNIAEIMGGSVAKDEQKILNGIVKEKR